jgi:hypothetical protein
VSVTTASPLIDWSLLGRVALYSLVAGVGVVIVFSLGLVGLSVARSEELGRAQRAASVFVSVIATSALAAALWWAFVLITNKS